MLAVWASAVPASAQTPYERFSLDTTVGVDLFRGDNVSDRPQIIVDIIGTVQLGDRWQIYVRPWFRLPRPSPPTAPPPAWDTQLYQASLRYERPGPIATRVDAGYMASPVGLGLFDANPSVNPTIAGHSSYFTPMLPFDAGGPRGPAIASTYPLGAVLTLSATRWDARAAVVNSAPVRSWVLGAATNPRRHARLRSGRRHHADDGPSPRRVVRARRVSRGRGAERQRRARRSHGDARRVRGRLRRAVHEGDRRVRSRQLHHPGAGRTPPTRGSSRRTQTLSPRWSIGGRHEGTDAPVAGTGAVFRAQPRLLANELTAGYRVTREITVKASYYARQPYGRLTWDQQGGVQVVWQKRWW